MSEITTIAVQTEEKKVRKVRRVRKVLKMCRPPCSFSRVCTDESCNKCNSQCTCGLHCEVLYQIRARYAIQKIMRWHKKNRHKVFSGFFCHFYECSDLTCNHSECGYQECGRAVTLDDYYHFDQNEADREEDITCGQHYNEAQYRARARTRAHDLARARAEEGSYGSWPCTVRGGYCSEACCEPLDD